MHIYAKPYQNFPVAAIASNMPLTSSAGISCCSSSALCPKTSHGQEKWKYNMYLGIEDNFECGYCHKSLRIRNKKRIHIKSHPKFNF